MLCMLSFINHYNILRCQSNKVTKAPNKARPADTKLFSPEIQFWLILPSPTKIILPKLYPILSSLNDSIKELRTLTPYCRVYMFNQ